MEIWLVALVTGDQILRVCAIRSGRTCLLASLKEANICTESRHCWILDFFLLPESVSLSYCRLKRETYLLFSFSNMFAVTLILRNKIKITLSLKMWGRANSDSVIYGGRGGVLKEPGSQWEQWQKQTQKLLTTLDAWPGGFKTGKGPILQMARFVT